MDRSPVEFTTGFYSGLASHHADIIPAFLACLMEDPATMKRLQGQILFNHYFNKRIKGYHRFLNSHLKPAGSWPCDKGPLQLVIINCLNTQSDALSTNMNSQTAMGIHE